MIEKLFEVDEQIKIKGVDPNTPIAQEVRDIYGQVRGKYGLYVDGTLSDAGF